MAYYRKHEMQPDDNPPIGILLCTEAGHEMVEYVNTLVSPDLFVSKYQLELPTKEEITAFLKRENGTTEVVHVALRDALADVKKSVGKGVVKSVVKIFDLIAQCPDITRERLAQEGKEKQNA